MTAEQKAMTDWKSELDEQQEVDRKPVFKIGDGERKEIIFLDEGTSIENKYGRSVLFNVKEGGDEKVWFINKTKFSLLKEIKANAPLKDKKAAVLRIGKEKTDTRYSIKFLGKMME